MRRDWNISSAAISERDPASASGRASLVGKGNSPSPNSSPNNRAIALVPLDGAVGFEAFELPQPRRVAELAQTFILDLANALPRDVEALADFFERPFHPVREAKTHFQNF